MILIVPLDELKFTEKDTERLVAFMQAKWASVPLDEQTCIVCNDPRAWHCGLFVPSEEYKELFGGRVAVLYLLCTEHKDKSADFLDVIETNILKERQ